MAEEKKDSGFVIKDKRLFAEGNETSAKKSPAPSAEEKPKIDEIDREQDLKEEFNYPPINFSNFVLSLSTSALFHFGDFPDSASGKTQKNLSAAKQSIDILDMINEKTKGNLNEQENNLIQGVLYELKIRYVKENS
ncbi:MAG: DUF1844 domain-containing protein [Smithellaceae bacterium]